jgi:hypothetical protein
MTREQKGRFKDKHPRGTTVDSRIIPALRQIDENLAIRCESAHTVALTLGVPPKEVGTAIDLEEGRIHKCQLGLFGYSGKSKIVKVANNISAEVQSAIEQALDERRRLTCVEAWRLAEALAMPRLSIANACEALGVKIMSCQLGAF